MSALSEARPLETRAWAEQLGVPEEAVALYRSSDVIDLHLDSFIWRRILGYDLLEKHGAGPVGRHYLSHVDFPRAIEAGLTGGMWSITTNPARTANGRLKTFVKNLETLKADLSRAAPQFRHVKTVAEYRQARASGAHGAFIAIQGGNAVDASPDAVDVLRDGSVVRVTLVHLTGSSLGQTSAPSPGVDGLTAKGRELVRRLESMNVLVDLAHIGRKSFFDAVAVHDSSKPLIVTHTGVDAVYSHWRNVTDEQLRAIAKTGGTVGIMLHTGFLGRGAVSVSTVVDHAEHLVNVIGDDHVSLGSDFDGMISPPTDLKTPFEYPRLVAEMLRRSWIPERIRKFLGGNALRTIELMRG